MKNSYQSYLDFATETALLAGELTLGYFQTDLKPDIKANDTPVTIADRKAEKLIRSRIEKKYPNHAIVGEEFGENGKEKASHRWYIDPIDGTKAFMRGVPLYAVLLGLEIEGTVEVGVAYFPALDEMVAAASGLGCWWNGRRAHVSKVSRLREAVVTFTTETYFPVYHRKDSLDRIKQATYFDAGWGDAYGHMLVATGRAEIMMDPIMNDWDCGPFPPILREAGGYFGDWQGKETIHGNEALSTSLALLPEVLSIIKGTDLE
jgi:myo-inositol-1(or 4)-monophosphatase